MKNLVRFCLFSIPLLLFSAFVNASSLEADINNDAVKAQFNFSDKNADLGLSLGLLLTDDNGEVGYFSLRTQGNLAGQPLIRGGFGARAYFGSPDDDDGDSFQSLGLGGYFEVTAPNLTDLSLGVELYYAPSITSSDDIDNLTEVNFRASYQLFENAAAFVGLRSLEVEVDDTDFEIDEGAHFGFILQF